MAKTTKSTNSNEKVETNHKAETFNFIPKIDVICRYGVFHKGTEYQITEEIRDKLVKLGA